MAWTFLSFHTSLIFLDPGAALSLGYMDYLISSYLLCILRPWTALAVVALAVPSNALDFFGPLATEII